MIASIPVDLARTVVRRVRSKYRKAISPYRMRRRFGPKESVLQSWLAVVRTQLRPSKTILFVPEMPEPFHVAYRACVVGGMRMVDGRRSRFDAVHVHSDTTTVPAAVLVNGDAGAAINVHSTDISKRRVQTAFREVFEYELAVDPRTYRGLAVRKSDDNCKHDGEIVECPTTVEPGADVVYQKLVETNRGDGYCLDHRVPIVGKSIPFVYLKYRPATNRFKSFDRAEIVDTESVLTAEEISRLLELVGKLGIQFGEMDVLRDINDGRIYVVDANHTPSGPPRTLSDEEGRYAAAILARSYRDLIDSIMKA